MIDMHAHIDHEKSKSSTVIIHVEASVPEMCTDIELIVANIIKGLATQLPESPDLCLKAATMFSIAATQGAKRGLEEYMEETE